jgi:hypothetical protein
MLWVAWAGCLAIIDSVLELIPGTTRWRRHSGRAVAPEPTVAPRSPRLPSLTPTG